MFKRINIILYFFLLFAFDTISSQDNFKIFIPKYIPERTGFEVSIITSNKFPEADKLDIYFLAEQNLTISKIEFWVDNIKRELPITSELILDYSEQFKKMTVEFSDTSIFNQEKFFQLVLYLKPGNTKSNSLKFFGEYLNGEKVIGRLVNSDLETDFNTSDFYILSLDYYQKSSIAENAISLGYNSYLNIAQMYNFEKTLEIGFWLKVKNFRSDFFKIIDWETNWVEYSISINDNQIVAIDSKDEELLPIKPYFVSNNIWYHFHLSLNRITNELSFYINGTQLSQTRIRNYINPDNLVFHFQNNESSGEILLEQFRIVEGNGSSSGIVRNSNYEDYYDDSSKVIFQMDFSETEMNELRTDKKISYEQIKFIKSDAPVFLRGPKANVKMMNNFYEVEWSGGSFSDADYYVLEKAVGNGEFTETGKVDAVNDREKTYSLLSEHIDQTEIIYFRIKQVNKDGSIVYSEVVKVGQGLIEDLIIGQNYPNPFNPTTTIEFDLLQDSDVEVIIYDLAGKEVAILYIGFLSAGSHKFKFDATGLPSGIYLYQIKTALSSQTRKMILAK